MGKTKVMIDYSKCGGENGKVDPRDCGKCLQICDPAVFLRHPPVGLKQDPRDPEIWQITAVWLSLCTRCSKCVEICPEQAIKVSW